MLVLAEGLDLTLPKVLTQALLHDSSLIFNLLEHSATSKP
jgi:hypothetical protein